MMHRTIRGCLLSAVIAGGLLASNGVAAHAAGTTPATSATIPATHTAAPFLGGTVSSVAQPSGRTAHTAHTAAAAGDAAPAGASASGSTPPADTNVNTGLLVVGVLFLVFGGLLALILGRKRG
ncbi:MULTISPECIES: hypothetical protein [Micrococcaceae]|uniref:Peptidoglycan/LPS O-acetylase OafA/YrhL n=1 Tax=Pseudarthrobacter defluvii TaxID=410837 RepID=A0ABT9UIU5_9MICC|nr:MULTISPECIES: hypothetical protein [Micrococcaceae]MDE8588193.1 hypothetical protein [Arthrobacter sp. NQ4]MDQ0119567.1 peptidoglycan/LPS O-acetylase OafA/YrhL [Pseudarthrobacter defluvii]